MNQFPTSPWVSLWGCFDFFEISRKYLQLKVHHRCCWHQWQKEKSSIRKDFIFLFGHFWVEDLTYDKLFPSTSHWGVSSLIFFLLFTTGVIDTGVSVSSWHWQLICHRFHLPPVSWIPVLHLALRISPRIFEKIKTDPNVRGKMIHEKKPKTKILVTLSL